MSFSNLPAPLVGPGGGRKSPYPWRGLMLDSARTCHRVESVKKVLQLAARYGFNRFHWHLTDDQGWRFEVPGYEKLTTQAAYLERAEFRNYDSLWDDTLERAIAQAPGRWTNGYYTDEEIKEVVALAAELGIEIIPEVDFPGHMAAAIECYPQIGRPADLPLPTGSMREHMHWPAANDLLWPNEDAFALVKAALVRVMELFPGRYVHIGGDECAYQQWESDPKMVELMRERGWDHPNQIQKWFMEIGIEIIRGEGKIPVVWDDICPQLDADVLVTAWGQDAGLTDLDSYRQDYIFTDAQTLYLNRVDPDGDPNQKGMVPGVSVDGILRATWNQPDDPHCAGVETCLWSEFVLDHDDVMQMLMPRLLAVAARMWRSGNVEGEGGAGSSGAAGRVGAGASGSFGAGVDGRPPMPPATLSEAEVSELKDRIAAEYEVVREHLGL
ncbi:MAG: family 20 glycosylhydrolase [Actinomycetaceae bacterium]|nr:family 20 glycosylhydrolase [Actinomycetaceae bacterium]